MKQSYTAVVKQDGEWWIGWIEEVPGVNCQERTREELLESLRVTLGEALEMNRRTPRRRPGKAMRSSPSRYEAPRSAAASLVPRLLASSRRQQAFLVA